MDPDKCLARIIDSTETDETIFAAQDLLKWIKSDGYHPEISQRHLEYLLELIVKALEKC